MHVTYCSKCESDNYATKICRLCKTLYTHIHTKLWNPIVLRHSTKNNVLRSFILSNVKLLNEKCPTRRRVGRYKQPLLSLNRLVGFYLFLPRLPIKQSSKFIAACSWQINLKEFVLQVISRLRFSSVSYKWQ